MSLNFYKKAAMSAAILFILVLSQGLSYAAGPWTTLNTPGQPAGTMLLLTDGRIMIQQGGGSCGNGSFYLLTPDSTGNYANGTFTTSALMSTPRLYYASAVLPSGKVWVLGGEYSGASCTGNIPNTGEIYDPVANSWSAITSYPNANFGDDPAELIPGGKIIAGDIFTATPQIYNIATNSWSAAATKVYGDRSDEEAWAKLANGNIVVYDLFESTTDGTKGYAEEYNPSTGLNGAWTDITPGHNGVTGTLQLLTNGLGCSSQTVGQYCFEMGPNMRLQDGRIFQIGANQHNNLYDPAALTWTNAPDTDGPSTSGCTTSTNSCPYGADDAPAAELPNGHIIYAADSGPTVGKFDPPTVLFDFNPAAGTIVPLAVQPPAGLGGEPAFVTRMLMLPNGQMLFGNASSTLYFYNPNVSAPFAMRPVVSGISPLGGGSYQLTGNNLNGQSAGAYYGDDVTNDENYPIVRLVGAGGTTYYCKTTNWSSVGVGPIIGETVDFAVPAAVPAGNYELIVSGAGIQGIPVGFVNP